jgi:uncharacterized repeat protein (TIGR04076 family)
MPYDVPKCKVTVIKRLAFQDLADEYRDGGGEFGPCGRFEDGQEFVIEHPFIMPEDFCPWAWADIRKDILAVATGSSPPWIKKPGTIITGCTDWFRPVIFEVTRID